MSDDKFVSPEEQRRNRDKNRAAQNHSLRASLVGHPVPPPPPASIPLVIKRPPTGEPAEVIELFTRKKKGKVKECSDLN